MRMKAIGVGRVNPFVFEKFADKQLRKLKKEHDQASIEHTKRE